MPEFGFSDIAIATSASEEERELLFQDLLGSIDGGVILAGDDKAAAKCHQALLKAADKVASTKLKVFGKCKKTGLAGKKVAAFASALDLETCFDALIADAVDGKVAKAVDKLAAARIGKCDGVLEADALAGACSSETEAEFDACLDRHVECRICRMLNLVDELAQDCDLFDDGLANASCASTALVDGSACTVDRYCASDYCGNGFCCVDPGSAPDCCATATDCAAASCTDLILSSPACTDSRCEVVQEDCDDDNVCTDDACSPSGCQNTDNSFAESCYDGAPLTEGVGECVSGTRTCSGGAFGSCVGQVLPTTEVQCNGVDEDCDGSDLCVRDGSIQQSPGQSCLAILASVPSSPDGIYWIDPNLGSTDDAFQVQCDMTSDGGGWTELAAFGSGAATIGPSTYANGFGSLGDTDYTHACSLFGGLDLTDTTLRVTMGVVVDYFKPTASNDLCSMLGTHNQHTWSASAAGPFVVPAYFTSHLGGSALDWPLNNVSGDGRNFLTFWGGNGSLSGCCHEASSPADTPLWNRAFTLQLREP